MPEMSLTFKEGDEYLARCYMDAPNMASAIHGFGEKLRRIMKDFDGGDEAYDAINKICAMWHEENLELLEWE